MPTNEPLKRISFGIAKHGIFFIVDQRTNQYNGFCEMSILCSLV